MLHSKDPDALMAPVYRGYVPNFDLMPDDIRKIQALYENQNQSQSLTKRQSQGQSMSSDKSHG